MGIVREILHQIARLFTWWFIVAPWEQAVRVRFGRWVKLLGSGIHLALPFVDRVYKQSTRLRITGIPVQTIGTRDGRTITVAGAVGFAVKDLRRLFETLHAPEATLVNEVMGRIGGFVMSHGHAECTAAALQEHVRQNLDLSQYGLDQVTFFLTDFAEVRTFRLIGDQTRYTFGSSISTE